MTASTAQQALNELAELVRQAEARPTSIMRIHVRDLGDLEAAGIDVKTPVAAIVPPGLQMTPGIVVEPSGLRGLDAVRVMVNPYLEPGTVVIEDTRGRLGVGRLPPRRPKSSLHDLRGMLRAAERRWRRAARAVGFDLERARGDAWAEVECRRAALALAEAGLRRWRGSRGAA